MNPSNENHEPATVDDFHDRLIDRGLSEIIGNEAPPDLSTRILAAERVAIVKAPAAEPLAVSGRRRRFRWLSLAVAATLMVGVSTLLLSNGGSLRKAYRDNARLDRNRIFESRRGLAIDRVAANHPQAQVAKVKEEIVASDGQLPSPYYLADDVEDLTPASGPSPQLAIRSRPGDRRMLSTDQLLAEVRDLHERGLPTDAVRSELARRMERSVDPEVAELYSADFDPENQLALKGFAWHDRRLERDADIRFRRETADGTGPGLSGDQYTRIVENPFIKAEGGAAVSTFSIDVDTASYSNVRQFLMQMKRLPPPDAVRIEELINYFDYDYAGPNSEDEAPFAAHVEVAGCPWRSEHRLVRIGIKGREMDRDKRPQSNLVFLVDVSGSMNDPNKLPLVVYGLQQLTRELGENDRVAIVVYASSEGLVLPSTPGSNQGAILGALEKLQAGGSTAGGAGIQLAYQIAEDNFIEGGTNRVVLCTDGDFNVGVTSTAELERMCEKKAADTGVFLSVLGFGRGNLNDAMMEAISNKGNGNYAYVDNRTEARRVLVDEMTGTLVAIAKDVKIQVEFNPRQVAGYRLLGYENRMLRTEDFNDDSKDAGEIGAGHTVTALYEVVPAGKKVDVAPADDLKYQQPAKSATADAENEEDTSADMEKELLTLKMRYKQPDGETSKKLEWPITDDGQTFSAASDDFQFAAGVAGFGLLLRDSQYKGNLTYDAVAELAQGGLGEDKHGYRAEFVDIVRQAESVSGN
jgi:Ca-activated chloride channel family protein